MFRRQFVLVLIGFLLLTGNPTWAELPVELTDEVSTYDIAEPKLYYSTSPVCNPTITSADITPQAVFDAEIIRRVPTYGGLKRTLFRNNVSSTCGQQLLDFSSNIIGDDNYVYWLSKSSGAIVRLSSNANEGDIPEILGGSFIGPVELTDDEDSIYIMTTNAGIWRVNKSDGSAQRLFTSAGESPRNFQTDGKYLYWIDFASGAKRLLRIAKSGPSLLAFIIATGVNGYHPEGRVLSHCIPIPFQCFFSEYVFIGKGHQIVRFNNIGGDSTTVYTSSDTSAIIYSLTSTPVALAGRLFFYESRVESCPFFCIYNNFLIRIGRGGGIPETLYVATSDLPQSIIADHLRASGDALFWTEAGNVMRLPQTAKALVNMRITGIEVTQGIQDLANSVQLIENRRTFVRVYVESDGPAIPNITAYLYRMGFLGTNPIDGPLVPVNPVGTHLTVQANPNRDDINHSFLFELPWDWTTGGSLRLKAELNPNKVPGEPNFNDNNQLSGTHIYRASPRLEVQFVSWGYILNNTYYYPRLVDDVFQTYSWIRRAYPLASTAGLASDPSPGFRPNLWIIPDDALGSRVNRTAADCLAMDAEFRSLCASHYTNTQMGALRTENGIPSDVFMYGMISDEAGFFPRGQACCAPGTSSGPVGTPASGDWDTDSTYGDWYAGHEIGHTLGRNHPAENADDLSTENVREGCGHDPADLNYPYTDALIGPSWGSLEGFDVGDTAFGLPVRIYPSDQWHDFMTYCGHLWISDYTYNGMYNFMSINSAAHSSLETDVSGDFLSVYGLIALERGSAVIQRLRRLDSVASVPEIIPGDYSIRLKNGGGTQLASYPFTPQANEDFEGTILDFAQVVDYVAGTSAVQIVETATGKVLTEQSLSANPPTISNVRFDLAPSPVTGTITLRWNAFDPDGDPLRFDVFNSRDNGRTFQPLQLNISGRSIPIDTSRLGGSNNAFLRVVASDGVHTASAQNSSFRMAFKAPEVRITSPSDGLQTHYGQLVNFSVEYEEFQDSSIAETNIIWSDQSGEIGRGHLVSSSDLPVGANNITVQVRNSLGLTGSDNITIFVDDDLSLPGPTLSVGPSSVHWQVAAGTTQAQTAQVTISNAGSGEIDWTASEDATWLTMNVAAGSAPSTVTLSADPSGLPNGTALSTAVNISATTAGVEPVTIPVYLSVGDIRTTVGDRKPAICEGDFDSDGDVDGSDLTLFSNDFGRVNCASNNPCDGDFDNDGDVDGSDLSTFSDDFGRVDCPTLRN